MQLEYYGHSMWRIAASGFSVVLDPFDNIGYPMPQNLAAEYVIISHEHHDHNNVDLVKGNPEVIRTSGLHQNKDFRAELIPVFHDYSAGAKRGKNHLIRLEIENLTLLHCGDLGHLPSQEVLAKIDQPDILMIPVGEVYTLDLSDAWTLIKTIKPKLILPMHYKTEKLTFGLGSLESFTRQAEQVELHDSNKLDITPDLLTGGRIIVVNWAAKE
ncbi:MAG: MBL fold metallo-hydrolase [Candidatus Cloacimonadaceae bacterium]